ncbi:MAG: hypothetical protein VYD87_01415 [Pseudomonadota bacterium]|nr:hypothetical protein [Pseudomonadota bacterium]MEE3101232.1 hypothetical protein [Pseudomonadota bacterium]
MPGLPPPYAAPVSVDARVREVEAQIAEALQLLASPHAPDRRLAAARLASLVDEATAASAQASALIGRAMTAASYAAAALSKHQEGDAA